MSGWEGLWERVLLMDQTLKPQKFKKYLMTLDTLRKTVTNILRTGMWLVTQPSSKSLMANVKSAESFNRKIKNQLHNIWTFWCAARFIFFMFSKLRKRGNVTILTVSIFKTAFWLFDSILIAFSVLLWSSIAFSHLIFFAVSTISPDTWGGQYVEIPCSQFSVCETQPENTECYILENQANSRISNSNMIFFFFSMNTIMI